MRNKIACFFFICCLIFAGHAYAGDRRTCNDDAPGENIYKHYTGTIGGRKVILDLRYGFCGASNYGGSYFYSADDNETRCIMIYEPENFTHNSELHARERALNYYRGNDNEIPSALWSFVINGNKLTGKWLSADKKTTEEINLTEDYTHATRLDVTVYRDTAATQQPDKPLRQAYFTYLGIRPSGNATGTDLHLINDEILKLTNTDKQGVTDMETMPAAIAQQRFNEFTRTYGLLPDDTTKAVWNKRNFYYYTTVFPVYNDNKLLSLELANTGTEPADFACIDLARNRLLKLADVLKTDNNKLPALIKREYKNSADTGTIKAMPLEKIGYPEKFMITGKGVVFYYPYDGGGYIAEVRVFVSYLKLSGLLKAEFRERMGL